MKKILILSLSVFLFPSYLIAAENIEETAEQIYNNCQNKVTKIETTDVLGGNIKDVNSERQIRQCLKEKILELTTDLIIEEDLDNFKQALNNIETTNFDIFRSLIFCTDKENSFWCSQAYKEDTSLGKLLLEKQLTQQMYLILQNTLKSKSGYFNF